MQRYLRVTAHTISESLGYATPITAAVIGLDGMYRRKNYFEWIASCYAGEAKEALTRSIRSRHYHVTVLAMPPRAAFYI